MNQKPIQPGQVSQRASVNGNGHAAAPQGLAPLAVDVRGLATLLQRSVASLARDNAAGRLPAAVKIGSSVRWLVRHIELWLEWGCPSRAEFTARLAAMKK